MTDQVLAAIDSSQFSESVCDFAARGAKALNAPLSFIHTVDNYAQVTEPDITYNLGLGTREYLFEKISDIEEQHTKISRERAHLLLNADKERAINDSIADSHCLQRNGTLVETLVENNKCACWW